MIHELDLSIIVPVYNEVENLRPLSEEITAALVNESINVRSCFY